MVCTFEFIRLYDPSSKPIAVIMLPDTVHDFSPGMQET